MKGILCCVALALAVLALSFASPVSAATNDIRMANAQVRHHHHWQPKKAHYGKRMRAHWGPRCKMSGSC
jgi:Skp family chaperone for outer membrane proteins